MKKEYLTIKEFASEAGVTQQAVYKQLKDKLQPYLKIVDNKKMLHRSALELFAKRMEFNQVDQQLNNQLNNQLINMLQKELVEKGEQLREKDKQIAELQKLLDQSQKLHAMDKQRILELEDKTHTEEEPKRKWWQRKKIPQE